jgi:hypothetical protein
MNMNIYDSISLIIVGGISFCLLFKTRKDALRKPFLYGARAASLVVFVIGIINLISDL